MPRDENIFYRLAAGEDATTELLCNFLQYAAFRRVLLPKLFPGSDNCDRIEYEDIDTQFHAGVCGRPDIVVKTTGFCGYVEVKIDEYRGTTANQPVGYLDHLKNENEHSSENWLTFLTPKGWMHRQTVEEAIAQFKTEHDLQNVKTSFFTWEEMICLIEENDLNRLNVAFADFHRLLVQRYRPQPVKFNYKEMTTMFTKEIPESLQKLDRLIGAIEAKCSAYRISRRHRGRQLCPQENGIYFQNESGQDVFFFGEWTSVWINLGHPLCFGVSKSWANAEAFREGCRSCKEIDGWLVGLVPREVLAGDNVVEELWQQLDPIISAIVGKIGL